MPHGLARKVRKRMEEARRYLEAHGCATLSALAKVLGVSWDRARHVVNLLEALGEVSVFRYGGKLLWCVDEEAAAVAVSSLRTAVWRLICASRRRYISPTELAKMAAANAQARKIFANYVPNLDKTGGVRMMDAALRDLLGEVFDKRTNKKIYLVPADFCERPPRQEAPERYKPRRSIVTFKVTEAMARDMENAAAALGVGKAELVRMAIERLIEQYRHVAKT